MEPPDEEETVKEIHIVENKEKYGDWILKTGFRILLSIASAAIIQDVIRLKISR